MHRKVAFIGGVGSGKTTIISELSRIEPVNTDVESTVDIGKPLTTVGIDYGHIALERDLSIGLYGVPGQQRFSFVWDFVKDGLWAVVILVKNRDRQSLQEAFHLLEYFEVHDQVPCVIAVSHADLSRADGFINEIHELLTTISIKHSDIHN